MPPFPKRNRYNQSRTMVRHSRQNAAGWQHAQPEEMSGLVERVTFHSEETGFCVVRISDRPTAERHQLLKGQAQDREHT